MILKKLRTQRNWSQEQLAQFSDLSVRTIQRIEAGGKSSLESLKSLASVLEVNVSTLEQEIVVIDKTTEEWQRTPIWLKSFFVGSNSLRLPERHVNIRSEQFCVICGFALLLASPFIENAFNSSWMLFTAAYFISLFTRAGDKYAIW